MRDERGSVSLVVAALAAVLLVLAMGEADLVRVFDAAAKAQTAADAAALAAAQALAIPEGSGTPEELASEYAARNGAVLESCGCDTGTFEATVTVRVPLAQLFLLGGSRSVVAKARAVVDLPSI